MGETGNDLEASSAYTTSPALVLSVLSIKLLDVSKIVLVLFLLPRISDNF